MDKERAENILEILRKGSSEEIDKVLENITAEDLLDALEIRYSDDEEAMKMIEKDRNIDIPYVRRRHAEGNYEGQTPLQVALELAYHLFCWH